MLQENSFINSRRLIGALLGLALGLIYSIVSGSINSVLLWGIPLQMDFGAFITNVLFAGLGAMVAGYITAWPQSSFKGALIGALAIALFGVIRAFINQTGGSLEYLGAGVILLTIFLPSVVFALPITGLLRLVTNWYMDALSYSGQPRLKRLARVWAGLIVVGVLAGSLSQMSANEQAAVRQVHRVIQAGLAARSESEIPRALKSITDFRARAAGPYTLAQQVDVSQDTIAGSVAVETVEIEVVFQNGLRLQCLAGQTLAEPLCSEVNEVS